MHQPLTDVRVPAAVSARPRRTLTVLDAVSVIIGIVIGAGIFRTPALVAANVDSSAMFIGLWLAGGMISLIGALCYAELASAYPDTGGDYHFLHRAFGDGPAFLFAWARLSVIQTGSIAMAAYVLGDYATALLPLGPHSSAVYALLMIAGLTAIHLAGLRPGKWTQNLLSAAVVLGLLMVAAAGLPLLLGSASPASGGAADSAGGGSAIGLALVFVLLTFGGWNEAAYLSAEVRGNRRNIARALMLGIAAITIVYLLVNLVLLYGLGLSRLAASEAVMADLMQQTLGSTGAGVVSLVICVAALSTAHATILTGARSAHALGRDFPVFATLGAWRQDRSTPTYALIIQAAVAAALVLLGAITPDGFRTMVEYTAPVFWLFFGLSGVALIVLRQRHGLAGPAFRVPLYPLTPLLFCAVCAYMLWSSLSYTGTGALVGVAVLAAGVPLLVVARMRAGARTLPSSAQA